VIICEEDGGLVGDC